MAERRFEGLGGTHLLDGCSCRSGSAAGGAAGRAVETREMENSARGVAGKKTSSLSVVVMVGFATSTGVLDLSLLSSSSEDSSGVAAPLPASLETHSSSSSPVLDIVKPVFCFATGCLFWDTCGRF